MRKNEAWPPGGLWFWRDSRIVGVRMWYAAGGGDCGGTLVCAMAVDGHQLLPQSLERPSAGIGMGG